jgi:hypothetical protein
MVADRRTAHDGDIQRASWSNGRERPMSIYLVHYANAQQRANQERRNRRRTAEGTEAGAELAAEFATARSRVWRRIIPH